jgi:hypothetical protein
MNVSQDDISNTSQGLKAYLSMCMVVLKEMDVFEDIYLAAHFLMYDLKGNHTWQDFVTVKTVNSNTEESSSEITYSEELVGAKLSMSYIGFSSYRAMLQVYYKYIIAHILCSNN